ATYAGAGTLLSPNVERQILALVLGLVLGALLLVVDYHRLERWAWLVYGGTLLLLAATLVLAPVTRGNQSWLVFGPLRLQPSELAKLGLVIALARWFHPHPPGEIRRLRELWRPALIAAGPVGLIVLQQDLGVAVLTLLIASTFLLFVRIPTRAWLAVAGTG